jgi:hypothetical protein
MIDRATSLIVGKLILRQKLYQKRRILLSFVSLSTCRYLGSLESSKQGFLCSRNTLYEIETVPSPKLPVELSLSVLETKFLLSDPALN